MKLKQFDSSILVIDKNILVKDLLGGELKWRD